ncbi:YMGG-like glycine zipper-containing protein [Accumulibacter sp.]|uniref:YMGG-like glycine zipper-containing protein n=1 Tax=Accumulibacter sp. TaxID=2053492 RepID=UPI0025FD9EB1|nr:YMGG-like glycine zipper-containing protein [Accumulibacter sp.]MCM8612785.1 glycine zipper domain-containing protein [Accumulibacter sp.]MCM8637565.1 glycine zipper domain-containing protein [Accumulibacter sp.]MCM8639718.1 glycine zipper domain-containing protein [Accumulibacter sp.]
MKQRSMAVTLLAGMLAIGGCANMSSTEQRTLSGAAIGTGVGAVVGAATGDWAWAAGGAAVGAAGGYLYDQQKQKEQRAYQQGVQAGKAQATPARKY